MSPFQRSNVRSVFLLLLILALPFGPIGCGAELTIPMIIAVATTAGVVAFTISQFQQIESAELDNQMKRLKLRGMQNGQFITVEKPLSGADYRDIRNSGKVEITARSFASAGKLTPPP